MYYSDSPSPLVWGIGDSGSRACKFRKGFILKGLVGGLRIGDSGSKACQFRKGFILNGTYSTLKFFRPKMVWERMICTIRTSLHK